MNNNFKILGHYDCEKIVKLKIYLEEINKNNKINFSIEYFHENEYFNEIRNLKEKNFENHEIKFLNKNESPIILNKNKFFGDYDKFFNEFIKRYYIEINLNNEEIKKLAEKNLENELYKSGKFFVDFHFENSNKNFDIRIELFSKTPNIRNRFINLCEGMKIDNNILSYLNSNIKRVEKDNYIQLGEIENENLLNNLEEENFIYKHEYPGTLSMVTSNLKHTIKSQFFISLQKICFFNKNFVVFGKVVKGLDLLIENLSEKQEKNSYLPTENYKITKINVYEQLKKDSIVKREEWLANRQKIYQKEIVINSENCLNKIIEDYKNNNYLNGPEMILFKDIDNLDFFQNVIEIFLNDLKILKFDNCKINNNEIFKLLNRTNFFENLKEIYFMNLELNIEILKNFINDKINLEKLYFKNIGINGNDILNYIFEEENLNQLSKLVFRSSNLKSSSISFIKDLLLKDKLNDFVVLDLSKNNLYDDELIDFFKNYNLKQLNELYLNNCMITYKSLNELLNNYNFKNIKILDLSNCFDINPFLENFLENKIIKNIKKLILKNCYLDENIIKKLLLYPICSNLEYLDLSYNYKLENIYSSLKSSIFLRNLRTLKLKDCNISNDFLNLLIDNTYLSNLKIIDFSNNDLDILKFLEENSEDLNLGKWLDILYVSVSKMKISALNNIIKDVSINIKAIEFEEINIEDEIEINKINSFRTVIEENMEKVDKSEHEIETNKRSIKNIDSNKRSIKNIESNKISIKNIESNKKIENL